MLKHKATVWRAAPHLESYIDQPFEKYSFVSTRALLHSAKDVQIGTPRRSLGRLNATKQGRADTPAWKVAVYDDYSRIWRLGGEKSRLSLEGCEDVSRVEITVARNGPDFRVRIGEIAMPISVFNGRVTAAERTVSPQLCAIKQQRKE